MLRLLISLSLICSYISFAHCQNSEQEEYPYETYENDPLGTRIYTLDNGLKVYLTVYKDEPRIQTYMAIRAGSKNDPSYATGLAHYLEHMLFKGTSKIGSLDWEKEKVYLDKIENLYEVYRQTDDSTMRKKLYKKIDSLSFIAAQYAVPNEYDRLMSHIGATGTNAYTFFEQTVYINNIPGNNLEKWAKIEAERFSEIVPRLFHTELEAVYEEKNRGMDSDRRKVWEEMLSRLFPEHTYGTQTTIGTIEHLKNPSITAIKEFFNKYYVPNNMALCLSGDLDPEKTIAIIDKYFSKLKPAPVPEFTIPGEATFDKHKESTVVGPDAESVTISYRFPGYSSEEAIKMEMVSRILSNSEAGLIDINLNQDQKVLGAYSYPLRLKDYSMHTLSGKAKQGQSLEEVKDLLMKQIERVKKGHFEDWLLEAIINDYKLSLMKSFESNKQRADAFVNAFIYEVPWQEYVQELDKLAKLTKEDIVQFAREKYKENYVVVYKKTGKDTSVVKIPKPQITPLDVNRENTSEFFKEITQMNVPDLKPVFLDYDSLIHTDALGKIPVRYIQNHENELFELYYVLDVGSHHDKLLPLAVSYLNYIGTDEFTAAEIKEEFYKLGCSFDVYTSDEQMYVSLSGLQENFVKALKLFEDFMHYAKPDQEAYDKLIDRIEKSRQDQKLSKDVILRKALVYRAKYGKNNPFNDILTLDSLRSIKPETLTEKVNKLFLYPHQVWYYGPEDTTALMNELSDFHLTSNYFIPLPRVVDYEQIPIEETKVFFVPYDMVQSEMILLSRSFFYNQDYEPVVSLFNEYFGGSMGSIVFQEMREAKALAYAVRSYYQQSEEPDKRNYIVSYIGTQADKVPEAIKGMNHLLTELPYSPGLYENSKKTIREQIASSRITKSSILFNYEQAQEIGIDYDIRKDIYENVTDIDWNRMEQFYLQFVAMQPQSILVIGNPDKIDVEFLKSLGEFEELSLEELFGY